MRNAWFAAALLAASSVQCCAQFFPKSSLDFGKDDFKAKWYSTQLRALREPSLLALASQPHAEAYRFLWLRTFHHPVAVRLSLQADGHWVLDTKAASGAGGYSPGTLTTSTSRNLSALEAQDFLSRVEKVGFWDAPNPVDDQTGTDGSQWIIEGVRNGKYHVIDRWMPKSGPARELGMILAFELARMQIPTKEIY
jgi:hypothetical protein